MTIDGHAYGKSKTAFGSSVALIETRGKPFEGIAQFFTSYGPPNGVLRRKTPFEGVRELYRLIGQAKIAIFAPILQILHVKCLILLKACWF